MSLRCLAVVVLALSSAASAQIAPSDPWGDPAAVIIPEPYSGNQFNFDQAFADHKLKAIVLKAGQGDVDDGKVRARALDARQRHIPLGLYFWGVSTTPWTATKVKNGKTVEIHRAGVSVRAQVKRFLTVARDTGPGMVALDLEGVNDGKNNAGLIKLSDAEQFVALLRTCTGRDPVLYVNQSTMQAVADRYRRDSSFAKTKLWLAGPSISFSPSLLWQNYVLWQFGAEWDCNKFRSKSEWGKVDYAKCDPHTRYPVRGSHYDLDVNLYRGDPGAFGTLFGAPMRPDPACADT